MNDVTQDSSTLKVDPVKALSGEVCVPGDKSVSHRAIIFGAISSGVTRITNFLPGADNLSTIGAFRAMGVSIEGPTEGVVTIEGVGMRGLKEPGGAIDCGNSGTTARLLTGLLSAQTFSCVLTGDASLRKRPMKRVIVPLEQMGASIVSNKGGLMPLKIIGSPLKGITYESPIASAQVKSAILLAGVYATGKTTVIEPMLSRDHTERMLARFGADLRIDGTSVTVTETEALQGAAVNVPGDISSAAFFMVAAIITGASSTITLTDIGVNPTRCGVLDILKKMGGELEVRNLRDEGEPIADIHISSGSTGLKGVEIDGAELLPAIDEFPIICVAAAFAEGTTTITGAGELRVKESDRIAAMAESLRAVGVTVQEQPEGIVIEGSGGKPIRGGAIESRGDHRVAMAMAVAALNSEDGITITGPGCVDVSFPGFFDKLKGVSVI